MSVRDALDRLAGDAAKDPLHERRADYAKVLRVLDASDAMAETLGDAADRFEVRLSDLEFETDCRLAQSEYLSEVES